MLPTPAEIRVELQPELATSRQPARTLIYFGDRLVATVIAIIAYEKGGDGRYYPCVKLTKAES